MNESIGKITATVEFNEGYEETLQDVVFNTLADKVQATIAKSIEATIKARIEALADEEFSKLAKARLEEYFIKIHTQTDSWGTPTKTVSLQVLILEAFQKFLSEKVDKEGCTNRGYTCDIPRTQWMLTKLAHEPLKSAIDETVKGIAAKARDQIQASVSRYIADQLAPRIDVPALGAPK